jgi:hypothetical protein
MLIQTEEQKKTMTEKFMFSLEEDTVELAEVYDIKLRVTQRDGKNYACTMDFRFDRIDVHIDGGIVTKVSFG